MYFIQIQKGAASARSDDTKSLKGAIINWITPQDQSFDPPLAQNVKTDHGFHHEHTGALLCPQTIQLVILQNSSQRMLLLSCKIGSHGHGPMTL
jgi:hypothetical protein